MPASSKTPQVLQFHVYLVWISPMSWRRVRLRPTQTLADLHAAIQLAFRWSGGAMHEFRCRTTRYAACGPWLHPGAHPASDVKLGDLRLYARERFDYTYDFTANWRHQVRFESSVEAGSQS
jgi:hypothetical protein